VAALADMYNVALPRILGDLTALRDAIVDAVNTQHRQGYGLNDPAGPPPGRDFFEVLPSGDVRVRQDIVADPSLVAAASGAGLPGDASNAVAIANLRDALVASGGTATIGQFYQAMIARIGTETQQVETIRTNQEAIVNTVDRQRQEVSSVSLDEEAANLVKYQHAYAAAARAMTVVDEMLDKIVNGMGIVGR
ncbi:MAG: flagellar hook-associated protein FlgK, partial [Thermomicrobiaceae bacterium]|nr:flagellar hook-associated protein FlgK [Thermomicrobiaceae bacterium]